MRVIRCSCCNREQEVCSYVCVECKKKEDEEKRKEDEEMLFLISLMTSMGV